MTDANTSVKTLVSTSDLGTSNTVTTTAAGERVVLVPMAEWKQSAQRGVRSFIQCATFLLGGGSLALFLASFGIAPDYVAQIPTSGNKLLDALLVSFVFGLVCFVWNWCEFFLDIDIKAPKFRA